MTKLFKKVKKKKYMNATKERGEKVWREIHLHEVSFPKHMMYKAGH